MEQKHVLPAEIERESMRIIAEKLYQRGISLPEENAAVIKRVIHTTADFDYAENLRFTPKAVEKGIAALKSGVAIITDTNMAKAGISGSGLKKLNCEVHCFIASGGVAEIPPQLFPWRLPGKKASPAPQPPWKKLRRNIRGRFWP